MFTLLQELGRDAARIQAAVETIEGLQGSIANLNQQLADMASFKDIVIQGLNYLAAENEALKAELATKGELSTELYSKLALAQDQLREFLAAEEQEDAAEAAEDALEAADREEILGRLSELVPPPAEVPAPAPVEPDPEPAPVEPAPTPDTETAPVVEVQAADAGPLDQSAVTLETPPDGFGAFPINQDG